MFFFVMTKSDFSFKKKEKKKQYVNLLYLRQSKKCTERNTELIADNLFC